MESLERVLAICVNWNGGDVLSETLHSLLNSDYPRLDILVVDNASTDDSLRAVPRSVSVLRLRENRGYGAALNAGVKLAVPAFSKPGGDGLSLVQRSPGGLSFPTFIFAINNDVVVMPETIRQLVDFARQRGPGIYGPKVLRYGQPNRLDAAWGKVNWSHVLASFEGKEAQDSPKWSGTKNAQLLLGCALLIHRRVMDEVGLFEENFFMYHEEVDFLYRAHLKALPVYYCGFAQVLHHVAYATRRQPRQKFFWVRRNAVLFLRKHRPGIFGWSSYLLTLLGSLLFHLITFRWDRFGWTLEAVRAGFGHKLPQARP